MKNTITIYNGFGLVNITVPCRDSVRFIFWDSSRMLYQVCPLDKAEGEHVFCEALIDATTGRALYCTEDFRKSYGIDGDMDMSFSHLWR